MRTCSFIEHAIKDLVSILNNKDIEYINAFNNIFIRNNPGAEKPHGCTVHKWIAKLVDY